MIFFLKSITFYFFRSNMAPIPTEVHQRLSHESTSCANRLEGTISEEVAKDRKLIGIDGKWYDVSNFISKHPGGPVIQHFLGKDATIVFHTYGHSDSMLKYRKPVGTYKRVNETPADQDFEKLMKDFKRNGYFETDWGFYNRKFVFCAMLWSLAFYLVSECKEWYLHYIGAIVLTCFWEQCGFLMHDFMHILVFRDNFKDRLAGVFFGTICFGPSAHWWKDDHDIHHSVTNIVNIKEEFVDPQCHEQIWAQNPKMFPLYRGKIQEFLIKFQHITFLPAVIMLGRIGILIDSYLPERRWYEWLAITLHWTWVCFLLSFLPTWREVFIFYSIASMFQGSLHIKLLVSHYSKQFLHAEQLHSSSWFEHQLKATMNIDNVPWMDWFYGGLNLHIEHHFFPKLARSRYRDASRRIRAICKKHGLLYDSITFPCAILRTLQALKQSSIHFSLDPR